MSAPPTLRRFPGIALVAHRDDRRTHDGLKLLATVLGCPQLRVQPHDEPVAPETVAVIRFGSFPIGAEPEARIISVVPGTALSGEIAVLSANGDRVPLPSRIRYEIVFNGFDAGDDEVKRIRASYFFITNGFVKAEKDARQANAAKWAVLAAIALSAGEEAKPGWAEVFRKLGSSLDLPAQADDDALKRFVADADRRSRVSEDPRIAAFMANPVPDPPKGVTKLLAKSSHLLPLLAWRSRHEPEKFMQIFEALHASWKPTAARLADIGCAYAILGADLQALGIVSELLSPAWRVPGQSHIRKSFEKDGIEKSPSLLALLLFHLFSRDPGAYLECDIDAGPLAWDSAIEPQAEILAAENFFDGKRGLISQSLFENWLKLQDLPVIPEGHLFLADRHYEAPCQALERIWREIVFRILSAANVPLVELKPWPHGAPFALALRYDVDRKTSPEQIAEILRIQNENFGKEFSSWYFFAEAAHNAPIRVELAGHAFEDACHTCRADDVPEATGATAHSGPQSEYWTGRGYIRRAEARGASYAEGMLTRYRLPRPGWAADKMTGLWLTPLHFPLEGSTRDTTTQYFDKLLAHFRDQKDDAEDFGGLVIIGSHPDCNQTMLEDLIARETLTSGWTTTVSAAVARIKSVFGYGAVQVWSCAGEPGAFYISVREKISDLVVQVRTPSRTSRHSVAIVDRDPVILPP